MKISPGCRRTDPFPRITIKVSLGEHNHGGKIKPVPVQYYHVTRVTIHPNFTNELHTRPDGYIEVTDINMSVLYVTDLHRPSHGMMSPCSDWTGQPRPLPSVCLTGDITLTMSRVIST